MLDKGFETEKKKTKTPQKNKKKNMGKVCWVFSPAF